MISDLLLLSIFSVFTTHAIRSSHNQIRRFDCRRVVGNENSICSITLMKLTKVNEQQTLPGGLGCFQEHLNESNSTRLYCPIHCEGASSAFVISKLPSNNHRCLTQVNYHVEKREDDWYFWRSDDCLRTEIQFDLGCTFDVFEAALKVKDFVANAFKRHAS
ncbi:hypothetical protein M3Y95_00998200 [Aphelenchoides besseyi]|nr:hypothetical protein M3Y95_00998200 [Aphelenchoides besseyi]